MSSRNQAILIGIIGTVILLVVGAFEIHSMLTQTHLPIWAIALLVLPGVFILAAIWVIGWWLSAKKKEVRPRWFVVPLFLFSFFLSAWVAHRGADYYFLVYLYGSQRVDSEQLQLVRTGKNNPWPVVSMGRQIDSITDHQVWMHISNAIHGSVFFATFIPIFCLLPRKGSGPLVIWMSKSNWSKH